MPNFLCAARVNSLATFFGDIKLLIKPEQHKSISEQELAYIKSDRKRKAQATAKVLCFSVGQTGDYQSQLLAAGAVASVFAMLILGNDYRLPTYLKSARGFSWAEMGWLASLPFVRRYLPKRPQ